MWSIISLLAFTMGPVSAEESPVEAALATAIIQANTSVLGKAPAISLSVTTNTTYAEEYLEKNPRWAGKDHMTTVYQGVIAGDRYRLSSTMTLADGQQLPDFLIAYDGAHYNYLNATGRPFLQVSKSFVVDSNNALPLGTVAFLPYSFLFPTSNDFFVPNISIKRLTDGDTWERAFKSARAIDAAEKSDFLRIKFVHPSGTSYVVTFSITEDYFPIAFEKYGADGSLAQRYNLGEFNTLAIGDKERVRYPKKGKLDTFLAGWPRNTITIDTTALTTIDKVEATAFAIDPSLADTIYDLDTNVQIPVPK